MTTIRTALAALAALAVAAPLAAQGTCEIETRKPYQLTSALLYINRYATAVNDADRSRLMKSTVKVLTDNPDRIKNEAGRNYLLGQIYVRWFQDAGPRIVLRAKRSDLGFTENPDGEFFLPAALDEAMGIVEREKPACADTTARYRNAVFAKVLNASINYYNAKSYDSAIVNANHALLINPRSPQVGAAYQVIANASQAKGDLTGAITSLQQAIAKMGTDAASLSSRAQATFNLAILTRDQAMKEGNDVRTVGLRRAADLFKGYLDLAPNGDNASTARAAYARSLQDAGDTAAVAGIYADMLANPGTYTAIQLFEAGVVEANGKKFAEAARLYESGLQKNPWYRDALFNVANVYMAQHEPEKMAAVMDRLRAIDPMNPDVLRLVGAVWQERGKLTTDAKAKKTSQDSVIAYIERASKLPARVTITQFTPGRDNKVTIAGAIENLGATAASIAVKFELVDKDGKTVTTIPVAADGLAPKATKEFSQQVVAAGAVAWRYTMQ